MKTIFFGNNKITFSNNKNYLYDNIVKNPSLADIKIINNNFITKNNYHIIIDGNISSNYKLFKKLYLNIEAAGGVVLNSTNKILLIKRLNKYDLPKGKKEKGEKIVQCAVREVEEECGISNLQIIKKLYPTFHVYKLNNELILKTTNWFLMKYKGNKTLKPQLSEEITEAKWIDLKNFKLKPEDTYPNIIYVLNQIKSVTE